MLILQYDGHCLIFIKSKAANSHEPSRFWTQWKGRRGSGLEIHPAQSCRVTNRRQELTTCWYLPALAKTSSPSQIPEVLQETRRMCSWELSWLFPAWTAADLLQSCYAGLCSGLLFWSLQKVRGYGMAGHKNGRKVLKDVVLPDDLLCPPAACEWPTREVPTLLELLRNIPYS